MSGLGKGVTISSVGRMLQGCGLRVTSIKIDPYLNVDAGTMSPFEHGEVRADSDLIETLIMCKYFTQYNFLSLLFNRSLCLMMEANRILTLGIMSGSYRLISLQIITSQQGKYIVM